MLKAAFPLARFRRALVIGLRRHDDGLLATPELAAPRGRV